MHEMEKAGKARQRSRRGGVAVLGLWSLLCGAEVLAGPVTGIQAEARDGQVFVTWAEGETPPGTTFNVYVAGQPVTDLVRAREVGHHVEPHSARDWWEDPASFSQKQAAGAPVGFLLRPGGQRLAPRGGLFVHTPGKALPEDLYFAVTSTSPGGEEDRRLWPGDNVLIRPVKTVPGALRPIWQGTAPEPGRGAGRGLGLALNLHAKGGVVADMEYLVFGDESMGWREGLPFKFSVRIAGGEVVVAPTDRVWINRPHQEAADSGVPAIWTFWYGYNSNIFDRRLMAEGVPTNYTERRNLWILAWVHGYYGPDGGRGCCSGSSMGGCGTVSFGLRHPEWFAGLYARVPIVAYTYLGRRSAARLEPACWTGPISDGLRCSDGAGLLERMDSTRFVARTEQDLPVLFLIHGRRDGSMPWENNPPFYRALNAAHQAFAVYWDNGDHSTAGKDAPEDVRRWARRFREFRLDESYPAFSNTSSNRNPGDGRPEDGDVVGWMNRGMDWQGLEDEPGSYGITVTSDYAGVEYPVRTDITLRRVQRFHPAAGDRLSVEVNGRPAGRVERDRQGRIRILGVEIPSREGARIAIRKAA